MTETEEEKPRKGPLRDLATIADLVSALRREPETPVPEQDAEHDEAPVGAQGVELSDTLPVAPEDDLSGVTGKASPRLVSIIESLLFAAERPLGVKDLRRVLKEPTVRQVQLALKQLLKVTEGRGVVLGQVAGGFRLRTNPENARYVQKMLAGRPARLSRMQLETLAIVAYRQPITKSEVDHVRGVDCGAVLKLLLERDLLRIVGRKEEAGRPHMYGTTVEFLEFFNLMSLRDMPDLHQFRELSEDSREHLRERYGDAAAEVEAEVMGQGSLFGGADADEEVDDSDDASSDSDDDDDAEEQWQESALEGADDEPEPSEPEPEPEPGDDRAD